MDLASRRDPFATVQKSTYRDKPVDPASLLALINEVSRGWELDAAGNPHELGNQYNSLHGGPNTTLGLVVNGTNVDFMVRQTCLCCNSFAFLQSGLD